MPYYRTCPHCGAALDPGERCDCLDTGKDLPVLPHRNATKKNKESPRPSHWNKEKAAPVLPHRNGQKVKVIDQTTFTSNNKVK